MGVSEVDWVKKTGAAIAILDLLLESQQGATVGGADGASDSLRGRVVLEAAVVLVWRTGRGTMWVRAVAALGGWPGNDVGTVVRARVSVLAEVELERLNLQQKRILKKRGERGGGKKEE